MSKEFFFVFKPSESTAKVSLMITGNSGSKIESKILLGSKIERNEMLKCCSLNIYLLH